MLIAYVQLREWTPGISRDEKPLMLYLAYFLFFIRFE
jgi:hypothetical protein